MPMYLNEDGTRFWSEERKRELKKLVAKGYLDKEIRVMMKIPDRFPETIVSGAIYNYALEERKIRAKLNKGRHQGIVAIKKKEREEKIQKKIVVVLKASKPEEDIPEKKPKLRIIPKDMNLTSREIAELKNAAPLPPFHPVTRVCRLLSKQDPRYRDVI